MLQNRNSALGSAYVKLETAVTTAGRVGPPLRGAQRAPLQTQCSEPQPRSRKGPGPLRRGARAAGTARSAGVRVQPEPLPAGVRVQPGPLAPPGADAAGAATRREGAASRARPSRNAPAGRRPLPHSLQPGLTFRLSHGAEPACGTNAPAAIETRRPRELAAPAAPGGSRWLRRKARGVRSDKPGTLGPSGVLESAASGPLRGGVKLAERFLLGVAGHPKGIRP